MKIRDLDLDQYVIVYGIGKSEYSEGMTVVGRVEEIVFNGDNDNVATINSLGNLYEITDYDEFELWSKSIEGKTERLSEKRFRKLNVGDWIQYVENNGQERFGKVSGLIGLQAEKSVDNDTRIELELLNGETDSIEQNSSEWIKVRPNEEHLLEKDYRDRFVRSNDVQQRKRNDEKVGLFKIKDLKVGYKVKVLGDNMTGEVTEIADNGKSAQIRVDDGVYRDITDNNDFTILEWNATPQYAEDIVNHPSHYNYGDIEVINFIEQVTKHYNPNVAYHIGNAIKYLARSPHKNGKEDVDKARWYIERAFENWDVK